MVLVRTAATPSRLLLALALVSATCCFFTCGDLNETNSTEMCVIAGGVCVGIPLYNVSNNQPEKMAWSVQIVVSRWKEDVRWLDAFPDVTTVVYNRGGESRLLPVPRRNMVIKDIGVEGREDDTVFRYVLENYMKLAELVIFLQGWPFDHCAGVIQTVRQVIEVNDHKRFGHGATTGLVPITNTFHRYSVSDGMLGLPKLIVESSQQGTLSKASHSRGEVVQAISDVPEKALTEFKKLCDIVLEGSFIPCPGNMWVAEGGQWAVSKARLRRVPRFVYKRLMEFVPPFHAPAFRGSVMEVLWPLLWGVADWAPFDTDSPNRGTLEAARQLNAGSNYCQLPRMPEVPGSVSAPLSRILSCEDHMAICKLQQKTPPYRDLIRSGVDKGPLALGQALFNDTLPHYLIDEGSDTSWQMQADLIPIRFDAEENKSHSDAEDALFTGLEAAREQYDKVLTDMDVKAELLEKARSRLREAMAAVDDAQKQHDLALNAVTVAKEEVDSKIYKVNAFQKMEHMKRERLRSAPEPMAGDQIKAASVTPEALPAEAVRKRPTPIHIDPAREMPVVKWTVISVPQAGEAEPELFRFRAPPRVTMGPFRYLVCQGETAKLTQDDTALWRLIPTDMGHVRLQEVSTNAVLHFRRDDSGQMRCLFDVVPSESTFALRARPRVHPSELRIKPRRDFDLRSADSDYANEIYRDRDHIRDNYNKWREPEPVRRSMRDDYPPHDRIHEEDEDFDSDTADEGDGEAFDDLEDAGVGEAFDEDEDEDVGEALRDHESRLMNESGLMNESRLMNESSLLNESRL
eukprot:TRINITY_DN4906_c0_g1_i1.p1 TRINITY_DN4906_c0_g1~~TRINITY_DN4906_c0_g1_i1.p1  ORF type:complete len:818 (+),score=111.45 TRINITY_DN4906_c0_g1_i1:52-2454(+)